jgi:hypothetical protein
LIGAIEQAVFVEPTVVVVKHAVVGVHPAAVVHFGHHNTIPTPPLSADLIFDKASRADHKGLKAIVART